MTLHKLVVISFIFFYACQAPEDSTSSMTDMNTSLSGTTSESDAVASEEPSMSGTESQALSCANGLEWLTVPVRFHLLSSQIPTLNASYSESDVRLLLEEASTFWTQACVRFEIESIITNPLTPEQEEQFQERLNANEMTVSAQVLMRDAMPQSQLLTQGWNVMIFDRFAAPASGIYISEIKSVLWSERLPPQAPIEENPSLILAHEFGHSFGLRHYEGSDLNQNLMAAEVMQLRATAHSLNEEQIEQARQQVQSGLPF